MSRAAKFWLVAVVTAFVLLVGVLVLTPTDAATRCDVKVSAPADLQARLNAAGQGQRVCLHGTFRGNIRPLAHQTISGGHIVGEVDMHAGYVTFNHVEVSGGYNAGIRCGPHATIHDSYIHDNVATGIACHADQGDWFIRITHNRIIDNGTDKFAGHNAGGIKLLEMSRPNHALGAGATITGNVIRGSAGNGVWLDGSSNAVIVAHNTIANSTRHGVRCEKCGGPIAIRDNTISGSGYDGIDVTSSGVASVLNNTVTMSHDWGITIHEDWRAKKWWPTLDPLDMGWHLHDIRVRGNTVDRQTGCRLSAVVCHA